MATRASPRPWHALSAEGFSILTRGTSWHLSYGDVGNALQCHSLGISEVNGGSSGKMGGFSSHGRFPVWLHGSGASTHLQNLPVTEHHHPISIEYG